MYVPTQATLSLRFVMATVCRTQFPCTRSRIAPIHQLERVHADPGDRLSGVEFVHNFAMNEQSLEEASLQSPTSMMQKADLDASSEAPHKSDFGESGLTLVALMFSLLMGGGTDAVNVRGDLCC